MMGHMGMVKLPLLLATMALGYFVCVKADQQKGPLKELGYWIGSIIIIASVIIALCKPVCGMLFRKSPCMGPMPCCAEKMMHGGKMMMNKCPMCGVKK